MVYPIARRIIPPIIKLWIKEVNGLENVPKDKSFIVAANHASYFDDLAVPSIIVPKINKKLHIFTNKNYFKNFFLRKFLCWGGCIPVDVEGESKDINRKAFEGALKYLKNNEPVGIFPEGHRSIDGELQRAKSGVARLALIAKVPVLPVGIKDSYKVLPKGKFFPRAKRIIINIGKLMYFNEYYGKEKDYKILRIMTTKIMKRIAELVGKEYKY